MESGMIFRKNVNIQHACVIVLGGDAPQASYLADVLQRAPVCIAADSGASYCLQLGRIPDILVGDMDSLSEESLHCCQAAGIQIITYPPEKDFGDGELALHIAMDVLQARTEKQIIVLGAWGNRLDHTFANLGIGLAALDNGFEIYYGFDQAFAFIMSGNSQKKLRGRPGDTVSILPMAGDANGINLKGFYYPLENAKMTTAHAVGISNVMTEKEATIALREGALLVIYNYHIEK